MAIWGKSTRENPNEVSVMETLESLAGLLPHAVLVVAAGEKVVIANAEAKLAGLVREEKLVGESLIRFVRQCRKDFVPHDERIEIQRGMSSSTTQILNVRGVHLRAETPGTVFLNVEDESQIKLIDDVRRDFVANVSHELKTPIGALSILSEALAGASGEPEAVKKFADRIGKESNRLAELVQEIINLSKLQSNDPLQSPEIVSIDSAIRESIDRHKLSIERSHMNIIVPGESNLRILGSREQVVTAIANLISNAIAYSPTHTQIGIGLKSQDGLVEIAISDQGIGISASDRERIFERFYRVDPARSRDTGGTGLGLSIVKHVVANHGGDIQVWSREGFGSTFTIRFPLVEESSAAL